MLEQSTTEQAMVQQAQQKRPMGVSPGTPPRVKAGVMPLFSTWIYICEHGPEHLNERLSKYAKVF